MLYWPWLGAIVKESACNGAIPLALGVALPEASDHARASLRRGSTSEGSAWTWQPRGIPQKEDNKWAHSEIGVVDRILFFLLFG